MAAGSLLTLLDDIASILDDVAALTKVATKKTAGVLGDDLALNAEQVTGVKANREIPVVWAVAKGSTINKAILVPAALAISAFAPWGILPLLLLGGLFLCYEGVEKLVHRFLHTEDEAQHQAELKRALLDPQADFQQIERDKIKGAVRTDFILSAELIVIALGTVANEEFAVRMGVLVGVAIVMTVGVYGLVAGIVKLDDLGLYLSRREGDGTFARLLRAKGRGILVAAPLLMKFLSIAGTAAMFLVGGGIVVHAATPVHHFIEHLGERLGGVLGWISVQLGTALVGALAGAVVLGVVTLVNKLRKKKA